MTGDIAEIVLPDFDLGVDDGPLPERAQDATQIVFGCPIAIVGRCIKIVDPELQCACDGPVLLIMAAAHHQSGISTAAETDFREAQRRFRNAAILHNNPRTFDHSCLCRSMEIRYFARHWLKTVVSRPLCLEFCGCPTVRGSRECLLPT